MTQIDQQTHTAINWLHRHQLQELLESAGFAVCDSESTDELREAVRQSVIDGDIEIEILEEG